jgi:hypothetical protein
LKKDVFWIQIIVLTVEFFAVVLLGFEVYGHMNPDKITIEAITIGLCLAVNLICTFYKLYTEKVLDKQ